MNPLNSISSANTAEKENRLDVTISDKLRNQQFHIWSEPDGTVRAEKTGVRRTVQINTVLGIPKKVTLSEIVPLQKKLEESGSVCESLGTVMIRYRLLGGVEPTAVAVTAGLLLLEKVVPSLAHSLTKSKYAKILQEKVEGVVIGGATQAFSKTPWKEYANNIFQHPIKVTKEAAQAGIQTIYAPIGNLAKNIKNRVYGSTTAVVKKQISSVLDEVRENAELVLEKAGVETKKTILQGEKTLQNSFVSAGGEVEKTIENSVKGVSTCIEKGGDEVRMILETASQEIDTLLCTTGEVSEELLTQLATLLEKTLDNIEKKTTTVTTHLHKITDELITKVGEEVRGVIIEVEKGGQLLIRDTGTEIRLIANAVLAQAFGNTEILFRVGGEEIRSIIGKIGEETTSFFYELPLVAESTSRGIVRGLFDEIKNQTGLLTTAGDLKGKIESCIDNSTSKNNPYAFLDILKYLYDQDQETLTPYKKVELYCVLIRKFNNPKVNNYIDFCFLVAATALKDKKLQIEESGYLGINEKNLALDVVKAIPGERGRQLLLSMDVEKATEEYFKPKREPCSGVTSGFTHEAELIALQARQVTLLEKQLQQAQKDNERLTRENEALRKGNEFLKLRLEEKQQKK